MPFSDAVSFRTHLRTWTKFFLGMRLGPFHEMASPIVRGVLTLGRVQRKDHLFDIGCGDARVLITAARTCGCRATGIELDARVAELARSNVAAASDVSHLINVRESDARGTDISEATVVTLYLSERGNAALKPILTPWLLESERFVREESTATDAASAPSSAAAAATAAAAVSDSPSSTASTAPASTASSSSSAIPRRVVSFLFPMPGWDPLHTELDPASGIPIFLFDRSSLPGSIRQEYENRKRERIAKDAAASAPASQAA